LTPLFTTWARSEATDMRILLSVLLLAPPAFCMGMMFPLGLSVWRRHSELLPFFWSANGITSMLGSVLGMALSIEFGIAGTYSLGVGFYAVCALMIIIAGRRASRFSGSAASALGQDEVAAAAAPAAPSIQPTQAELAAGIKADKSPGSTASPAKQARAVEGVR
jgi:ABC-type branched-subunit amino acid transport system permease subunit